MRDVIDLLAAWYGYDYKTVDAIWLANMEQPNIQYIHTVHGVCVFPNLRIEMDDTFVVELLRDIKKIQEIGEDWFSYVAAFVNMNYEATLIEHTINRIEFKTTNGVSIVVEQNKTVEEITWETW